MDIPAPLAAAVRVRFAPLQDRDVFSPPAWQSRPLPPGGRPGWWSFDPAALGLPDGDYEYEFLPDNLPYAVADPYAAEITPDLNSAPAQLAEIRPIIQLTWRLWCQHRSRCEFRPRPQPLNGG